MVRRMTWHLFVQDLEKAAYWYCDNLGLTLGPCDFNNFVELHVNGSYFMHLFIGDTSQPLQQPYFYLDTANIELAYYSLLSKGVNVSELIQYSDHSSFVFTDLEGNKVGMSHFN